MITNNTRSIAGLAAIMAFAVALAPARLDAQFWDKLTKPQITLNLTHPPRLGIKISKVAFGPSNGPCSDEILDLLSASLVSSGIEVLDRQNLQAVLAEQHLSLSGYVDQQSAVQMGKLLGPTALIFVKVSRCNVERKKNYFDTNTKQGVVRTYRSITEAHIRGTLQTIDLTTGKIFSASSIDKDGGLQNSSTEGVPEFPSEDQVRDSVYKGVAGEAATFFVNWSELKQLYFFNDKDCGLKHAFEVLRAGDIAGAAQASEENLTACKANPPAKGNALAHAYYNAGLGYLLLNEHGKAMSYLTESEKLKGGDIVTDTIAQASKSAKLAAEMQRTTERTDRLEQAQADAKGRQPANAAGQQTAAVPGPAEPLEDRLKKLDALFRNGLISKEEFDAKKTQLLKEL
jgi:curli biogenesis system outer membrane secretion channel CsgG